MISLKNRIYVDRNPRDQGELDVQCKYQPPEEKTCKEALKAACTPSCQCSAAACGGRFLSLFPFLKELRTYRPRFLLYDAIAGLSVGIVHIPQSMGFALLASLPPVYGLYSSFWPVLLYYFFGTSRHLSLGTMAVISLVIASAVERELELKLGDQLIVSNITMNGNTTLDGLQDVNTTMSSVVASAGVDTGVLKASIATTLTLLIGLIQFGMGFLRLGIVTTFMPVSFVSGFTTATAFYITTSQLKHLFGITPQGYAGLFRLPLTWADIIMKLPTSNPATLVISACCLLILIVLKEIINERYKERIKIPIPAELIVVIIGTAVSYLVHLADRWNVVIVGDIPVGIPAPVAPPMEYAPNLIVDAIIGAILSFVISISLANVFTRKHKYVVDSNQELIAYGIMHSISSFFHCFAGAAAPPRCFVYESCGGRSSVAHLFSCLLLLIVLLAIAPLFQYLPNSVLGCVIIVALFPLFKQFRDLKNFWKLNRIDAVIWAVTCSTTVFLDIGIGLAIGIGFSIITIVAQPLFTEGYTLSGTKDADVYVPNKHRGVLHDLGPVHVFHFDGTLYFASAQRFKQQLYRAVFDPRAQPKLDKSEKDKIDASNTPEVDGVGNKQIEEAKQNPANTTTTSTKSSTIVLDCSTLSYIDIVGFNMLKDVHAEYAAVGVDVVLACCGEAARKSLQRAGVLQPAGPLALYPTLQDAVKQLTPAPDAATSDGWVTDEIQISCL